MLNRYTLAYSVLQVPSSMKESQRSSTNLHLTPKGSAVEGGGGGAALHLHVT